MNRDESFEDLRNTANCFVELEKANKKIKELEEENKELKDLPFIKYQKAILKITEVLDTKSIFIRKKKIKKILEEYYYESN